MSSIRLIDDILVFRALNQLACMSQNLEGSMLSNKKTTNKRKKRGWVDDMLNAENTPSDLIHQWSPNHKQLCLNPREKENDMVPFVLSRRSRRRKKSSTGMRARK